MINKKQLINFLLENERKETWLELAKKFNIKPGESDTVRMKAANDIWRAFLAKLKRRKISLTTVKKKYKEGDLIWETKARVDTTIPDTEGMEVIGITTGPYGSWTKYKNIEQYGLTNDQIKELEDKMSFNSFFVYRKEGSGVGVVDVSDIHSGALVKIFSDVVKKRPFDVDILIRYIDQLCDEVNRKKFEQVHLFIPGDIIESFTGFNHQDTYKNIQFHQGQIVIVAYQVLRRLIRNLHNCTDVYLVEGNHDRFVSKKESNSRKGIVEVVSYFLDENSTDINYHYHPFLVSAEIDNIFHICTHGDFRPFGNKKAGGYDSFFFKYGKQGMYNVLKTGHYHKFDIKVQNQEYLHYECPSIFTGSLFEEALGFGTIPAFTILENFNDICSIQYVPLKLLVNENSEATSTRDIRKIC